ncbi:hypothetical protein [Hyphococcus luteus]|uniref:hypothetical protein n=1 Tax=Hyphococcus luteus TaxID=2058213 RepID=UPI0010575861|nr:hypothetical protein [Marinicaulis flavus]
MPPHWTETNKHKAKEAFETAPREVRQHHNRQAPERPPQPQLKPKGPLRDAVDRQVREKAEAIKAKFTYDRQKELARIK